MKATLKGVVYDTDQMLNLSVPPTPRWMDDEVLLAAVYADQDGRLFIEEHVPDPGWPSNGWIRRNLTRCNAKVTAYLVERFGLPRIYLRAAEHEDLEDDQ